jgi:hypothetical protein
MKAGMWSITTDRPTTRGKSASEGKPQRHSHACRCTTSDIQLYCVNVGLFQLPFLSYLDCSIAFLTSSALLDGSLPSDPCATVQASKFLLCARRALSDEWTATTAKCQSAVLYL